MNTTIRVNKLMDQYTEHGSIIIGVDFDFTLFDTELKQYHKDLSDTLIEAKKLDCILCLWTANTKRIPRIIKLCEENELIFDYINESPIDLGEETIKPHFNLLLDDTAGLQQAYDTLSALIQKIKNEN